MLNDAKDEYRAVSIKFFEAKDKVLEEAPEYQASRSEKEEL